MPHGCHIYNKVYDMENATICAYPQSDNALTQWKFVMRYCAKCPSINITDQETDDQYSNTNPSIFFHIYHLITRCTTHGRLPLNYNKICCKCKQDYVLEQPTKTCTGRDLVMMETTISNFHTSVYIPTIQKLAFQMTHLQILGTNHCGKSLQTEFKYRKSFQDVLCCRDYADNIVASFAHQIQSK